MKSRVLPEAIEEARAAAAWYDQEHEGRGMDFADAFAEAIVDIRTHPRRFPKHERAGRGRELRHYLLERFPYQLIYEVRTEEVVIVAVAHTSRDPNYWTRRKS